MTTLSQQKLILSNTLDYISHLDIFENQTNLTIWLQVRYSVIKYHSKSYRSKIFGIADQNNQDYLKMNFYFNVSKIILDYDLQNQIRDQQSLDIKDNKFEWIHISVQRSTFYLSVFNNEINITIKCNQTFNATLYTFTSYEFQILVYDQIEFLNEERIITNIALKRNTYPINNYINYLKILFYAKFYSNLQEYGMIHKQYIKGDSCMNIYYMQDTIYLALVIGDRVNEIFKEKIQFNQWLFYIISQNDYIVNIQFYLNNEKFELAIQVDKYINMDREIEYLFSNEIKLFNSQSLKWDALMIINNIEEKDEQDFRYLEDCQNFQGSICQNYLNHSKLLIDISEDVKLSNYFLNIFPNYYEYVCTDKKFYLKNQSCVEWPKYYGEYCYNCQYQQHTSLILSNIINHNYQYYFDNLYDMPYDYEGKPIGLVYEQDLNIFIFKSKIFIQFIQQQKIFIVKVDTFIKAQNVQYKQKNVKDYQTKYAFFVPNFTLCKIQNALDVKEIVQIVELQIKRYIVYYLLTIIIKMNLGCQRNVSQIKKSYYVNKEKILLKTQLCWDTIYVNYLINMFMILSQIRKNVIKLIQKNLTNQLRYDVAINDQQIISLIYQQQVKKLSILSKQFHKSFVEIKRQLNFEYLSQTKQTSENINTQKFIFYDVQYFIGNSPMLVYQNQQFKSMLELYDQIPIDFNRVQFDVLILNYYQPMKERHYILGFDFKLIENKSVTFNITFKINPTISGKCIQFKFTANEIIINNLNLSNIDSNCDQQFIVQADKIFINNLLVENSSFEKLFVLQNFVSLNCTNFLILNSNFQNLIIAGIEKNYQLDSSVDVKHIYFFGSQLLESFIQISNVNFIQISQISYQDTFLNYNIISIIDYTQQVYISNIAYDNITSQSSTQINIFCENFRCQIGIANITFYKAHFILSKIFRFKNIGQIIISSIYLDVVSLKDSCLIQLELFQKCYIEQIFSKQASLNKSYLLVAQNGIEFQLFNIYLMRIYCFISGIINVNKFQAVYINNFNIQNISLIKSFLQRYQGLQIHLQQMIIIKSIYQDSHLIDIQSYNIIIESVIIKNLLSNESSLIMIESRNHVQVKNMLVANMQVINQFQPQLIFIATAQIVLLYKVTFEELQVQSSALYFCIIKLNEILMMGFKQLFLKNINARFPLGQMTFIDSKIQDLKILDSIFYNIQQLPLINSRSKNLWLDTLKVKKITPSQAFIFHESQLSDSYDQLLLFNLNFNDITGSLLEFIGQKFMMTVCTNITIFNYLNLGSMFKFTYYESQVFQYAVSLQLYNIMIKNEKKIINQPNNGIIFLIQSPIGILIQQLYINNSNSQLLFTNQTFGIYITGLHIYNIHSQNQIIEVICEKKYMQYVKLNNFQMINVTSQRSVFLFSNFSFESQINLNQILIYNFKSETIFNSDISINLNSLFIYSGSSQYIFHAYQQKIEINQSLIANIYQQTILSVSRVIIIKHSEIVNSKIIYNDSTLTLEQSSIQGNTQSQNNLIKILLSLNNGISVINYQLIENNLYLSEFSNNNNYLYLPSGQDIQKYQYLDYKTIQYKKIYDSISFINKYQQTIECWLSQKYENQLISTIPLQMVPGLNIINNLVVTLNPFHKEKFIQLDLTCNQNNQNITYRTLIKTFNCQLGEYLNKDQCQLCDIDQKLYSVGYNQPICQQMDMDKIKELKIGQIQLYQFYWRFSLSNKYIEVCQTDSCLGGWKTGDQSCKIGYIGAICQECDINNLRGDGNYGKIDDECKLCYFDYSIYIKLLCLIIYQLAIIYTNFYTNKQQSEQYLFIRIAQRKFTEILLKQNVNQATIIFKLYYNYLLTLFLLKESIQFGYYISVSLNLIYNPNYIAIPQFDCLIHSQVSIPVQYAQLLYKILMPLLIFNIFLTIYIITIKLRLQKHSIYTIIVSLITIFQQNQYIIIQSLIRLSEKVQYSKIYWILEYKASQFYSNVHQRYLFLLIIPLIILFILTNIIIFQWTKIINRRIFNNLKISLFINKQYKNRFYYWEYVRMLYIYLFMVTIYSQNYNVYVIILTLIYCKINHPFKPFVLKNLNKLDSFIFIFFISSYFAILIGKSINSFHTLIILIVSNTILFKIFTNYFIHSFNHQYRKTKIQFKVYLIKLVPQLSNFINLQNTHKIKYYYSVLRIASKKQTNSISGMFPNLLSKSTPYTPIEIELSNLNIK